MRATTLAVLGALGVLSCAGWIFARPQPARPAAAVIPTSRTPVIVELFSSEGCSSCPPADAWLASLDRTQPIDGVAVVALEMHVDYWDRLGWRDPFGSPAFSARQGEYGRVLTGGRVYTPEILFDGHLVMPSGDEDVAREMMQKAAREPKAKVTLVREGTHVTVDVTDVPAGPDAVDVMLAVTESGLSTNVEAGENSGRTLAHAPVVRSLRSLGPVTGAHFHAEHVLELDPHWNASAIRAVAFVQRSKTRVILGSAAR